MRIRLQQVYPLISKLTNNDYLQIGSPCTPEWLSDVNVCPSILENALNYRKNFTQALKSIVMPSLKYQQQFPGQNNCKKPCQQIETMTRFISRNKNIKSHNLNLFLRLSENVKVHKKLLSYGWFEFIVDTGSSLGLWLGNNQQYLNKTKKRNHLANFVKQTKTNTLKNQQRCLHIPPPPQLY